MAEKLDVDLCVLASSKVEKETKIFENETGTKYFGVNIDSCCRFII